MSNDTPQNVSKNPIQVTFADTGLYAKRVLPSSSLWRTCTRTISSPTYPLSTTLPETKDVPIFAPRRVAVFLDDMYILGYLGSEDTGRVRGSISCTTGEDGSAQNVVGKIHTALRDAMGPKRNNGVHILHTVLLEKEAGSVIQSTFSNIEKDSNALTHRTWRKMYEGNESYVVVVAKIDVSDISMGKLQEAFPQIE